MGYSVLAAFLKLILSYKPLILVQSNGYSTASKGYKKIIYKWAQHYIDGFLFTGKENARSWIDSGIFSEEKVFEVMEGATDFKHDVTVRRREQSFLWVGRLDANKDPITILKAFEEYVVKEPTATLTMVYSDTILLDRVDMMLRGNEVLKKTVNNVGQLDRNEIENLYQTHQYFVLGSHYEGSGYSVMEAMTCGCVPIITRIPSFNYMTDNGNCALQFEPGDIQGLFGLFCKTKTLDYTDMQSKVLECVATKLSHQAIATTIYDTFVYLESKKQS